MRDAHLWEPTKFVWKRGRLRATSDSRHLSVGSRLVANLVAGRYQGALVRHAHGRLLDLGCGAVPFYAAYRDHVNEVTCVDWAASLHGGRHIDLECDLSKPLPFDDGRFDTILLSDVLEHLPEPHLFWTEAARLLGAGGKVILNVPFYYQVHEEPHDYGRYTEFALRRFAERAGLDVIELVPIGGAPEILADLMAKLLCGSRIGVWPAAALQALTHGFVRSRFGSRLSARTSHRFPFGYFMVAAKSMDVAP